MIALPISSLRGSSEVSCVKCIIYLAPLIFLNLRERISPERPLRWLKSQKTRNFYYGLKYDYFEIDLLNLMPQISLELIFVDGFKHYNKLEKYKLNINIL